MNVTVVDTLNDNTVEVVKDVNLAVPVALKLAANVCGVTVGVAASALATDGTCRNVQTGDTFTIDQR